LVGTIGERVGLGEGIKDGLGEGTGVVGNKVGLGDGTADGIVDGDGEGINDGLGVGTGVVGNNVGGLVGEGVGSHVSQSIENSLSVPDTCHVADVIGGVSNQTCGSPL